MSLPNLVIKRITISNDKGRLSKHDIEKMLSDAEKFKNEDENLRKRVEAKNQLEGYLFGCKTAVENGSSRLTAQERDEVLNECNRQLQWLERNQNADRAELESRLQIAQRVCTPVMMKLHGAMGGGGPSYARPESPGGPRITEVD